MGGLPKDYYKKKMSKYNLNKTGNGYRLNLDFSNLGMKLDIAQDALDSKVWYDVQKYMPLDTGALRSETNVINQNERGRVFLYPPQSEYGHYQYEGKLYVDPVYGKGAFYSPEYGFWSRPGVKKVPTDRSLTYSQPNATSQWGETAYDNHKDEWYDTVKRALS